MAVVVEEADETTYWLRLLVDGGIVPIAKQESLIDEADQLLRIFSASRNTATDNR